MTDLVLRLEELTEDDEDRWLTCLFCGLPRYKFEPPQSGELVGEPVEFTTTLCGNGSTRGVGVHRRCLERQLRIGTFQGVAYFPTDETFTAADLETFAPEPNSIEDLIPRRFQTPAEIRAQNGHCEWHGRFTGEQTPCCVHHKLRSRAP